MIFSAQSVLAGEDECLGLITSLNLYDSLVVENPSQIVQIHRWQDLETTLREGLKAHSYTGHKVVVRQFHWTRLKQALKTGSDRDASSHLWNLAPVDASAKARELAGVADRDVTYAVTFDLDLNPLRSASLVWNKSEYVPIYAKDYEILDGLKKPEDPGQVMAVYDPANMTRASEVEYWFRKPPKESLLFIIVPFRD